MNTNILKALAALLQVKSFKLRELYTGSNRANNVGVALEYFVKDLFCGTFGIVDVEEKDRAYVNFFSYLGNQNNPSDFIVRNGDAVEVKKVGEVSRELQLNSSYPKSKLHADDSRISKACKECDEGTWKEKDIIYAVGSVHPEGEVQDLWFVYGDCYAASREVYERILNQVSTHVHSISDLEFSDTNEIGRVANVDPLNRTYLRIRGMWGIAGPHVVFKSLTLSQIVSGCPVYVLMREEKYQSFPEDDRHVIETSDRFTIQDVMVPSPDNPAILLRAKFIIFT